jgi:hypothetical protein
VFTIAHEICHLISNHKRPRRKFRNRLIDRQYQAPAAKIWVRFMRQFTSRVLPIEREADLFAMSWLVTHEGGKILQQFLDRHPEKTLMCLFVMADALVRLPFRLIKIFLAKCFSPQAKS